MGTPGGGGRRRTHMVGATGMLPQPERLRPTAHLSTTASRKPSVIARGQDARASTILICRWQCGTGRGPHGEVVGGTATFRPRLNRSRGPKGRA